MNRFGDAWCGYVSFFLFFSLSLSLFFSGIAIVSFLPCMPSFSANEKSKRVFPLTFILLKIFVDSAGEPTILGLTPRLLPILEQVLGEPQEQLNEKTREQVVEMVRFIHGKQPQMVGEYPGLVAVARGG